MVVIREINATARTLEQTQALARTLADHLGSGDVLCLDGELGAGKTTFVAALAKRLGAEGEITSPTFTLENRHRVPGQFELLHCDLYRPGDDARRDLLPSMLEAREAGALICVEWGAPVKDWLTPYLQLDIGFAQGAEENPPRTLRLVGVPAGWPKMESLVAAWRGQVAEVEVLS